jgi:xylan 1,4-beta-xylosidase
MTRRLALLLTLAIAAGSPAAQDAGVAIRVDANSRIGPMQPMWAWFGYDEPNYTYMKDGRKLLSELAELSPVPVYVRAHNLLTTGDGTPGLKWGSTNAYTEDAAATTGRSSTASSTRTSSAR